MESASLHLYSRKNKEYTVYEYKIADQTQPMFRQFDKTNLVGTGMCGAISLTVVKLLTQGLANKPLPELLQTLKNSQTMLKQVQKAYDVLKKNRSQYFKAHRFEFGKDTQKTQAFMKHIIDQVDMSDFFIALKSDFFLLNAIIKLDVTIPKETEHQKKLQEFINEDRLLVYHKGEEIKMELKECTKPIIGITMDNNDHYISFMIKDKEVHVFNSLDGESLSCDAITLITNTL